MEIKGWQTGKSQQKILSISFQKSIAMNNLFFDQILSQPHCCSSVIDKAKKLKP